jgi:hypothetical protein
LGAFVSEKSTTSFFASTVARTALAGGFRTSFLDRNQNFENAPNISFGSNGEDWVHSFRKKQLQVFLLHMWPERPSRAVSHEVCRPKPKLRKQTKHDFWDKQGGLGAFVLEKSTASFFAPQVARKVLWGGCRTSFVDRNRNFENTPNLSFGSNGVDWVRSFR